MSHLHKASPAGKRFQSLEDAMDLAQGCGELGGIKDCFTQLEP
jgi:hypothetical protein